MISLSGGIKADIIETFNSASRYLDDRLNVVKPYFQGMVLKFIYLVAYRIILLVVQR